MLEWLAVRAALGLPRWVFVLIAVALLGLLMLQSSAKIVQLATDNQAQQQQAGAASQRANDLETTIERTEQGNAARVEIRDPGSSARYEQCLRAARTPANCQRFMPQ